MSNHPLHQIPGRVIGYVGSMGSGKSSAMTCHLFEMAEEMKSKYIVANYSFDGVGLYRYLSAVGNIHCLKMLLDGRVICRQVPLSSSGDRYIIEDFLCEQNCIYALDEAGIILGCRSWQSIGKKFLSDLAQLRHKKRFLFWAAQSINQTDKQLRELTTGYVWCCGFSRYNSKLEAPEQIVKFNRLYLASDFEKMIANGRLSTSGFKAVLQSTLKAKHTWFGFLNDADKYLFNIYPSFDEIGAECALVNPPRPAIARSVNWSEEGFNAFN